MKSARRWNLVASYGLSDRYINKGTVVTDKSITEAMMGKASPSTMWPATPGPPSLRRPWKRAFGPS